MMKKHKKKIISYYPEEEKKSGLNEIQLTEIHLKSDSNNKKMENLYYNDKSTNFLKFKTNKKEESIKTDTTKEEINYSKSDYISQNININGETPKIGILTEIKTHSEDTKIIKIETDEVGQSDKNKKISEKCLFNEDFPYLLFPSQKCTNTCFVDQLLDQSCKIECISEDKFKSLIQNVETLIKDDTFEDDKEIIIAGSNIICDITTTKIEHIYNNISYIDLEECETRLKQKFHLDYLIIIKFDKINENLPTSVEYEVYNPITKDKLDLSICKNNKINIDIPMTLDEHSLNLFLNFSSLGYDIYNKKDPFYNEICTVFLLMMIQMFY